MSERLVERYGEDPHRVSLMEVTEGDAGSVMEQFEQGGEKEPTYLARCACGWSESAKYYQPARQTGLAHARGVAAR
ncbi:MAG TPA: hypothetical protein VHL09_17585 [Dehalococcoidia bacterium]|nr:hypothetical protein [Dehalococcoidia bacterium]